MGCKKPRLPENRPVRKSKVIAEDTAESYKRSYRQATIKNEEAYHKERAEEVIAHEAKSTTKRNRMTPEEIRERLKEAFLGSKKKEIKASLPEHVQKDADYMAAVERGDTDTAQRMVDEAAKRAGYTLETWRGEWPLRAAERTDSPRRREPGIFTSQNKAFAAEYANPGSYRGKSEPRRFYVKADKVLDLANPDRAANKWMKEWGDGYMERDENGWLDRGSGESVDVSDLIASGRLFDYEGDWSGRAWKDLQKAARSDGYDVLVAPDAGGTDDNTSTIILNDGHIKLAGPISPRGAVRRVISAEQAFQS